MNSIISSVLNTMETVHELVRQRLQSPSDEMEKKIVASLEGKIDFWLKPFPRPSRAWLLDTFAVAQAEDGSTSVFVVSDPAPQSQEDWADTLKTLPESGDEDREELKGRLIEERIAKLAVNENVIVSVLGLVDLLPKRTPEEVLEEVNTRFVGMSDIKAYFSDLHARLTYDRLCKEKGFAGETIHKHHMALYGAPGTGKSAIARHVAELLYALDISGPLYASASYGQIIGTHYGDTEQRTNALLGLTDTLFIDEAYAAHEDNGKGVFGRAMISTLVNAMEHPWCPNVFFAGYKDELEVMLRSNPGLISRIAGHLHHPSLNREQLASVLDLRLEENQMTICLAARAYILERLEEERRLKGEKHFANARCVRKVVEALPRTLSKRFSGAAAEQATLQQLRHVTMADVQAINYKVLFGPKKAEVEGQSPNALWGTGKVGLGRW